MDKTTKNMCVYSYLRGLLHIACTLLLIAAAYMRPGRKLLLCRRGGSFRLSSFFQPRGTE